MFVSENASGKTKILTSITFLLDLLFGNKDVDLVTNKSFYTNKKTYNLEYTFVQKDTTLVYMIEIGFNEIVAERLSMDNIMILERMGNTARFLLNEEKVFNDISSKLLFLRRIYFDTNFYDNLILNDWFDYMKRSVYINCYYRNAITYSG